MTKDELSLYNDLLKLSKKANGRIERLEKLTGKQETFAVKQLIDYLDSPVLGAVTDKGRISIKKNYTINKMRAIKKATEEFLANDLSSVRGVKDYQKRFSKLTNRQISLDDLSDIYIASENYDWIYDYYGSEIWDMARDSKSQNWSFDTFLQTFLQSSDDFSKLYNDENLTVLAQENLHNKVQDFYVYIMKGK